MGEFGGEFGSAYGDRPARLAVVLMSALGVRSGKGSWRAFYVRCGEIADSAVSLRRLRRGIFGLQMVC